MCLAGAPAVAHAQEPSVSKRLALEVYEKGAPDRGLVDAFLAALAEIDRRAASITIVSGRGLQQRPERVQADAVVACGADVRCIAAVGNKTGATHVLFGRATAQGDHVSMQWLLVSVSTARIVGKFQATLTDAADARASAAQMASELLGVTAAELAESPAGAVASGRSDGSTIASSRSRSQAQSPSRSQPQSQSQSALASPSESESDAQSRTTQRSIWSSPRVVGSVAAVASGVVFFGAGVYFGTRSHGSGDGLARLPGGSALVAALGAEDGARVDPRRASVLLALGGLLVAGGGALWTYGGVDVAPVVSIGADASTAGVSVTW